MRPNYEEIAKALRETIDRQITSTRYGKRIARVFPHTLARLMDNVVRNMIYVVDGFITQTTGQELVDDDAISPMAPTTRSDS